MKNLEVRLAKITGLDCIGSKIYLSTLFYVVIVLFCLFDLILYVVSTISYIGTGLPGLNQY